MMKNRFCCSLLLGSGQVLDIAIARWPLPSWDTLNIIGHSLEASHVKHPTHYMHKMERKLFLRRTSIIIIQTICAYNLPHGFMNSNCNFNKREIFQVGCQHVKRRKSNSAS